MESSKFGLGIRGSIFKQDFKGTFAYVKGKCLLEGKLILGKDESSENLDILNVVSEDISAFASKNMPSVLNNIEDSITLFHYDYENILALTSPNFSFIAANIDKSALFLFALSLKNQLPMEGLLKEVFKYLKQAAEFFGIEEMLVLYRNNSVIGLNNINRFLSESTKNSLIKGNSITRMPSVINEYNFLLCGEFVFEGKDSIFTKAMSELLGIKAMDLYVGVVEKTSEFIGILTIPEIDNSIIKVFNMFLAFDISKKNISFQVSGSFLLKVLPDIIFTISCQMGLSYFLISASADVAKPVEIFEGFKLGDTAVIIGYDNGLTFGMLSEVYIRKLRVFGAIILKVYGEVLDISMMSAGVSELSLSSLIENFTGLNIPGMEDFDEIKLTGFDFALKNDFTKESLENKDSIVDFFNSSLLDEKLKLDKGAVDISPISEVQGIELVDKKRLRHYFIDSKGKLSLEPQFYYSMEPKDIDFGGYIISPGMFICGVIKIFNVEFKIYFSMKPNEGILGFLQSDPFQFGLFKVSESAFSKAQKNPIPLPESSILHQFLVPGKKGPLLYVNADRNSKSLSLYIDGHVTYAAIFSMDARIVYFKKYISLDLRFEIFKVFMCSFSIKTDLRSANSLSFDLMFIVDTAGLENSFKKVTDKLNGLVNSYKSKVGSLNRSLNQAQKKVDGLQREIDNYNRKIEDCKRKKKKSKLFKKLKYDAEIACYEVAKAGIKVAMGTATLALNAAKAAANLSVKIGEGVVKAIDAVIDGVLSLFYIRNLTFIAAASSKEQKLLASIEFVALGKEYKFRKEYSHSQLLSNPTGILSDDMNSTIDKDVSSIENNLRCSNLANGFNEEINLEEEQDILNEGIEEIKRTTMFLKDTLSIYYEEFGEDVEIADEVNSTFAHLSDDIMSNMNLALQMVNYDDINSVIDEVNKSINNNETLDRLSEEEKSNADKVIKDLSKTLEVYKNIKDGIEEIEYCKYQFETSDSNVIVTGVNGQVKEKSEKGNMLNVLDKIEDRIRNFNPDSESDNYINFSKETSLYKAIEEERLLYSDKPSSNRLRKSAINNGGYTERI